MPQTVVTSPDGKKYTVTHPAGASKEEILAYAKKNAASLPEKKPYEGTYGPLFDGIVEGIASTASGVAGGLGGIVGGLYDAATGEDYENSQRYPE